VSPSASNLHGIAVHGVLNALDGVLPADCQLAVEVEIRFARQLTRIPDAMIIRSREPARHWFRPDEVVLAVEIESPGSHVEDRITEPALCSQFGIPHFWRLEPDRRWITRYALDGRTYREVAAGARLVATEPVAVDVAVADLLPRWAR
jgi:Uma2 family endonuclease